MRDLKPFGPPVEVTQKINAELAANAPSSAIGTLHFCKSWIVDLGSSPSVASVDEIVAFTIEAVVSKSGTTVSVQHVFRFWLNKYMFCRDFKIYPNHVEPILAKVAELYPWIAIVNDKDFADKWSANREGCVEEAAERKAKRFVSA